MITWSRTVGTPFNASSYSRVVTDGTKYYCICRTEDLSQGYLLGTSEDKFNWTFEPTDLLHDNTEDFDLDSLAWANGVFCMLVPAGSVRGSTWTASDGKTWTKNIDAIGNNAGYEMLQTVNNVFYARWGGSSFSISRSTDGVNWVEKVWQVPYAPGYIANKGNTLVFCDGMGRARARSTNNGVDWTLQDDGENKGFTVGTLSFGTKWYFPRWDEDKTLVSDNGLTGNLQNSQGNNGIQTYYGQTNDFALAVNGTGLTSTQTGLSWRAENYPSNYNGGYEHKGIMPDNFIFAYIYVDSNETVLHVGEWTTAAAEDNFPVRHFAVNRFDPKLRTESELPPDDYNYWGLVNADQVKRWDAGVSGSGTGYKPGMIMAFPFREDELPADWYPTDGKYYSLNSEVGQRLEELLSDNFKADWGVVYDNDTTPNTIRIPDTFGNDGIGLVMRGVDGTVRRPGSKQAWSMVDIKARFGTLVSGILDDFGDAPAADPKTNYAKHVKVLDSETQRLLPVSDDSLEDTYPVKEINLDYTAVIPDNVADEIRMANLGMTYAIYLGIPLAVVDPDPTDPTEPDSELTGGAMPKKPSNIDSPWAMTCYCSYDKDGKLIIPPPKTTTKTVSHSYGHYPKDASTPGSPTPVTPSRYPETFDNNWYATFTINNKASDSVYGYHIKEARVTEYYADGTSEVVGSPQISSEIGFWKITHRPTKPLKYCIIKIQYSYTYQYIGTVCCKK